MNISIFRHRLLSMVMLTAAVMLLGTAWIGDDAFITLRVIDNFVNGYGLRYNIIERVQAYTHPLWLLFLTPFYALTRETMVTTMVLSVLLTLGALWLLATRLCKDYVYGGLLVLLALCSRSISDFATSGLENPLTFLLLALFVWQLENPKQKVSAATASGLLILNRLDLVILIGPAVAYLFFRAQGRERWLVMLAALFPVLAWTTFTLIYYGMPFPNTAYAKLGTGFSQAMLFTRGMDYLKDFVTADFVLALVLGKVIFDSVRLRCWATNSLGVGIVLYLAYIVAVGGDFMSGRFFSAPGFLALCLLATTPVPGWLSVYGKRVVFAGIGLIGILLAVRMTEQPDSAIPGNGIANERRYYYPDTGMLPVLAKWARTGSEPVPPWGIVGVERGDLSRRKGTPIVTMGVIEAGMPGYYAGPAVHNIDVMALTDAFLARLPAIPGARVGHYQRRLPPGYAETALNSVPVTNATILQPLLNDVTIATRAPLYTDGRVGAIWRLLSGHYNWVYKEKGSF